MSVGTRRDFLTACGAWSATGMLLRPALAWADPMGLPVGIQLYTVRLVIKTDAPGTLKSLQAMGYREVETAGFGKYSAKEFGELIRDAGLSCPSAHLAFGGGDPGPALDDAHALGVRYATCAYFAMDDGTAKAAAAAASPARAPKSLEDFHWLARELNRIGARAKATGLRFAYHNHRHEFERMPDGSFGYDVLLRETDPALVDFEIDCGWMVLGGASPVEYMKAHPSRFRMLHIKDFQSMTKACENPVGSELGAGFIDYKAIFAAGKAIGIEHAFAEQEGPYSKPELESARIDYAYLHSMR